MWMITTIKKPRLLSLLIMCSSVCAYGHDISFFLPQGDFTYNATIPTPKQFLGYDLGDQHVTYDMAVAYMKQLAQTSDRIKVDERGRTYQYRPLLFLYVSAPNNLSHLEEIRQNHLKLCNPIESEKMNVADLPVVTWLSYSIHGNEASGINASLAVAYFLAAAQGPEVDRLLQNSIIVMQPGLNPDGIQRFATWVNNARSFTPVKDPNSREFREPSPGSRTNHYWFDLNRDWVTVQHPESYFRSEVLYEWHPTIFSDFHEMGTTSGMYFSPGIETSHNLAQPKDNYQLTKKVAQLFHVKYLDSIGSLSFSKETYDTWFPGSGDVLPNLLGGVSFLFEQTSARGHIQERNGLVIRFSDAIRNQAYASYSTLYAGLEMKDELLSYQRMAYVDAQKESAKAAVKGYLFSNPQNHSFDREFFHILKTNNINVYQLNRDVTVEGKTFQSVESYIVPCEQQEYRMVRTIFEKSLSFVDSVFYDVSTWNVPLAFSMNYVELKSTAGLIGEKVEVMEPTWFEAPTASDFAYLCELKDFYAYKFLYRLLEREVKVRVGEVPFKKEVKGKLRDFDCGTLMIPLSGQKYGKDELYRMVMEAIEDVPVEVISVDGGWGAPIDLGSPSFGEVTLPKIALVWGQGASTDGVGAIWHLLDHRMQIPATLLEYSLVGSSNVDLQQYNIIILCGNFRFDKPAVENLKAWSERRNHTIIGIGNAFRTLNEVGVTDIHTLKRAEQEVQATYLDFSAQTTDDPNASIDGVILENYLDASHPIAYGMSTHSVNTIKNGTNIFSKPTGKYMSPVYYTKNPLLSGCITAKNLKIIAETPSVLASSSVIYFADDPCFRAHWFGSTRLLLNSLFFRELMPWEKIETIKDE